MTTPKDKCKICNFEDDCVNFIDGLCQDCGTKTTIKLSKTTKKLIDLNGRKGDSYDQIINKLLPQVNENRTLKINIFLDEDKDERLYDLAENLLKRIKKINRMGEYLSLKIINLYEHEGGLFYSICSSEESFHQIKNIISDLCKKPSNDEEDEDFWIPHLIGFSNELQHNNQPKVNLCKCNEPDKVLEINLLPILEISKLNKRRIK